MATPEDGLIWVVAAGKTATVSGEAYTGGKMSLPGWRFPVVVDLTGCRAFEPVPLLANHENRTGSRIGIVRARVTERTLYIEGQIVSSSRTARGIVEQAQAGADWQLSIGAEVIEAELVRPGDSRTINGQLQEGPFYHVKASVLREVSVVPVGSDGQTRLKIAARFSLSGGRIMEFEKWIEAMGFKAEDLDETQTKALKAKFEAELKASAAPKPKKDAAGGADDGPPPDTAAPKKVAATGSFDTEAAAAQMESILRGRAATETQRLADVLKLCASYEGKVKAEALADIRAKAIGTADSKGWDPRDTELALLRAERPSAPAMHFKQDEAGPKVLEAALCLGNGLSEDSIVKACGEPALEGARKRFGGPVGAGQFILECAWAAGFTDRYLHRGNLRPALEAAFSTQTASGILSNVANKVLLDAFMHVDQSWRSIARTGPVKDFKTVTHYRLTGDFQYAKVGPTGELTHAATSEESWTNQADTYGRIFVITRKDLINDDLGAFDDLRKLLGRGAALAFNTVFWTEFMDNSTFFTTGRSNYTSGSTTALDSDALGTAVQMFREMKDANSKLLGLTPKTLLVPPALETTAQELFVSTNLNTGGSATKTKVPNRNIHGGKYQPVVSPYLSDSGITGYSSLAWYLLADPLDLAVIEALFLDGNETPTVESADADFDTLGVQVRGYHDFGVSKADYYGGVKVKGEA